MTRRVAKAKISTGKTKHFVGLPPGLTGGVDLRTPMPEPTWLVIEHRDNGYFLFRYTGSRTFAGDTWHESLDHALRQAEFEYDVKAEEWVNVPEDVADPLEFAMGLPGSQRSERR